MSWRIEWSRRALGDFEALETKLKKRVATSLERVASTGQGDVKKLKGEDHLRLRVGDYRVILLPTPDPEDPTTGVLTVVRVLHRREAYR